MRLMWSGGGFPSTLLPGLFQLQASSDIDQPWLRNIHHWFDVGCDGDGDAGAAGGGGGADAADAHDDHDAHDAHDDDDDDLWNMLVALLSVLWSL